MEENRTRSFTHSGTDMVDIDGVKLHARWRVAGTQDYVASDLCPRLVRIGDFRRRGTSLLARL